MPPPPGRGIFQYVSHQKATEGIGFANDYETGCGAF